MSSVLGRIQFLFTDGITDIISDLFKGGGADASSAASSVNPASPVNPVNPANPVSPVSPANPASPINPASPAKPSNPLSGLTSGNVTDTLSDLTSGKINDTFQTVEGVLAIISRIGSVLLALLLCFTGYRRVRQWVSFVAFVFGAVLGYSVANELELGRDYWYLPLIIALAAGIILSLLGYKLFQLGLFVFCGAVSSWAVTAHVLPESLTGAQQGSGYYVLIGIQVIVFVLGGVLAVRYARTAIILISAIGGARVASAGLAELLPKYFPDSTRQLMLFVGLAVLGILVQFLTTRPDVRRRRSRDWD